MVQPTSTRTRTHTHTNTLTLSDTHTHTHTSREKKRLTSARSLGSKLSGIHPVVELPLLCFAAMPRPHPHQLLLLSLIRQRFTCQSASLQSIASSIGSHGTWLRGMPQRVQFIKLNTTVALCSSCSTGQWQLLPCSRMLYISFVSFSAVSAVSVAVFAVLFAISNRMYVLPYPVSSVPLCHYAICPCPVS